MSNIKEDHTFNQTFILFKLNKHCLSLQKAKLDNTVKKLWRKASLFQTYVKNVPVPQQR